MGQQKDDTRNEVDSYLALLGGKFISPPQVLPDGSSVIFHGVELKPHVLPALNPVLPDFVSASETVIEPDSFKQYIVAFKSSTAICLASLGSNKIVAVLDYHGQARVGDRDSALPQRGAHKVTLLCPYDLDYAKWQKVFDTPLSQNDFGNVLEDLVHTIHEPPLADLQEAIDSLRIDRSVRFSSRVNRRNGNVEFTYDEVDTEGAAPRSDGGGSVRLPEEVAIIVPIFQGARQVELKAKLRYRLDKGKVAFVLTVPGLDVIEREQFRSIGEGVRNDTSTPVFYTT